MEKSIMDYSRGVLIGVVALCLTVVGCGKVRQAAEVARVTRAAQDGKFTVRDEKGQEIEVESKQEGDDAGKMTVTTKEGTTTTEFGAKAVSEKDVGVAFYPGATVESGGTATSTGGAGAGTWSAVSLVTSDSFADVAKFYKDKYAKGNTVIEQPRHLMITIDSGENSGKVIMVMPDDDTGKTRIGIHAGGKQ
jgi:hypothetical protein